MTIEIDWAEYPEPHKSQLRQAIEQAEPHLSPEAIEVLNDIEVSAKRFAGQEEANNPDPTEMEAFFERLDALPENDQRLVRSLFGYIIRARRAAAEQARDAGGEAQGLMRVIERAQELEPEAEDVTVGQAIEILKAHGEDPGITEETLRKVVTIPPSAAAADA